MNFVNFTLFSMLFHVIALMTCVDLIYVHREIFYLRAAGKLNASIMCHAMLFSLNKLFVILLFLSLLY